METFGNRINDTIQNSRQQLFFQGEMTQLTYTSYDNFVAFINGNENDEFTFQYPIGYGANHQVINGTREYSKQELLDRAGYLAFTKLPTDNIYQLITIIETMLNDLIRATLIEFPMKISNKRKLNAEIVLESSSIEQIKLHIVDSIVNELAYKSPSDYADRFKEIVGINLLAEPVFHQYIELKATRDIHIHNKGIANIIYREKAKTLARVKAGEFLPVDMVYFLKSYECCIQLNEFLEKELDEIWPSQKYRDRKAATIEEQKQAALETVASPEEVVEEATAAIETEIKNEEE